jgi:hypothetical protein
MRSSFFFTPAERIELDKAFKKKMRQTGHRIKRK